MRLRMTSTRLAELLRAFNNKHGETQSTGAQESFDLACLRDDGFVEPYPYSTTLTTELGDHAVEVILLAIENIEIKEQSKC